MKKKQHVKVAKKSKSLKKSDSSSSYHHGDLRNLVIKIAGDLLEEQGIHNLSLRDVASRIGVSHTAPYRHFPRRIDLLYALTTRGFLDLRDTLQEAWDQSEDSFLKLRKAGENYIKLMWKHPRRTELMFGGEVNLEGPIPIDLQTAGKEAYLGLYYIVEYGQKKGDFNPHINTESMSMSVWSSVHGFAVLNEKNLKRANSREENQKLENQIMELIDMILKGIRS